MKRHILIFLLFLSALVGCYDNHGEGLSEGDFVHADHTIGELRTLNSDKCATITKDAICVGRVVSSDREGNFYRSVVVEDATGGVEIRLGTYNIEAQYPVGLMVALYLNGTAVMVEDGVVQLGLPPQSFDDAPREMEAQEVIDSHIIRSNSVEAIEPLVCDITSLDETICGRFVKVCNLLYSPLEDYEERDYHRFVDNDGNAVFLYVSPYADFYDMEIPTSSLSLQGVLYYRTVGMGIGKQFVIKPNSKSDISTTDNTL